MAKKKNSYDVFISYNHNDSDWVRGYLLPMLNSWGLKVAIDKKVFTPGGTLDDHIQGTIQSSERVIFVCTQHFMASKWCLFEVEKTLALGSITCIPLVLDGSDNVPKALSEVFWADLTDAQDDKTEWEKLCASLDGKWSRRSDTILADLQDLVSFFGGFMNNRTTTYVVQRSHNAVFGDLESDHMITEHAMEGISTVHILLGRIQKIKNVQVILSNDYSELSKQVSDETSGNYIVLGGSRPDFVTRYSGRDFDKFYWENQLPLSNGEFLPVNWDTNDWAFMIYKSRTAVDDMVMFLYSPTVAGPRLAAEKLLDDYWEFARSKKGKEFVQAYDYDGNLVFEHIYNDE